MNRAEFRVAYREARKVRRLERAFRDRLKATTGFALLSIGDAVPRGVRNLQFARCDFLDVCQPHVGLAPRTKFITTPRLPA